MQFVSIASGGAMGDAGAVIAVKSYGKVFYGNFAYRPDKHELLDYDKLLDSFPLLEAKSIAEAESFGWKHTYMGYGNSLFVRNDIYDNFGKAVSSKYAEIESEYIERGWDIEIYLYRNWVDVALSVIKGRKYKRALGENTQAIS